MTGSIQQGYHLQSSGILELVGADENVDPSAALKYSASVEVPITNHGQHSGEILGVGLFTYETGTGGAIHTPDGALLLFDRDPAIPVDAAALAANGAEHLRIIGIVPIAAADWDADASGAAAWKTVAIPFPRVASLWSSFRFDAGESAMNGAAGYDEHLDLRLLYRLDR